MVLTKDQLVKFREAAAPMVKFLNEELGHPHFVAMIEPTGASLSEGVAGVSIEEFIKD